MPGGNGTGPNGMGAMTGRAAGSCTGNATSGRGRGAGRGFGMGARGRWQRGGGYGMPFDAEPIAEQEVRTLEAQVKQLSGVLEGIKRHIEALKPRKHTE
jgi:hypothetical protein